MPQEDIKVTTSVQTLVEDTLSSQQERHGGGAASLEIWLRLAEWPPFKVDRTVIQIGIGSRL